MGITENTGRSKNGALLTALILVLAAGVAAGSVYLARNWGEMGEGVRDYLGALFSQDVKRGAGEVFKTSLASNIVTLAVLFGAGFFRFGFVISGAVIARKGFIMGFTVASFIKSYGMKGIVIMLSTMPSALICVPAMLLFASVSIGFSIKENKFQKKIIFSYIFFAFLALSIFCAASFAEGFITTTFMKWIKP